MNKQMTAKELKQLWFNFFEEKSHARISSASVVPENDPSVLFTTAGMHPLVPYLLGQKHPYGKRLCDVQKCIRTGDIDEVGDMGHLTFFEMLGNWSLGDYFKEEMIPWSYEFLTSPKYLGLDKNKIAVTVFAGNDSAPLDADSARIWEKCGIPKERIFFLKDNWWILASGVGPCGPDSEMFIDTGKPACGPNCNPSCDCGKYLEIWNDVFMQFRKDTKESKAKPLAQKNVDTGMGLERTLCMVNGVGSVYETEIFAGALAKIEELTGKKYVHSGDENTRAFRIIADHVRTATAILGDEHPTVPSNTDAGYVLRRLIRRSVINMRKLGGEIGSLSEIAKVYIEYFKEDYPEFFEHKDFIVAELIKEEEKFAKTIKDGEKEFEKVVEGLNRKNEFMLKNNPNAEIDKTISGKAAFRLYETYGFPLEITKEMAQEQGLIVDEIGYKEAYEKHQELARTASAGHFKGGLADTGEETTRLHTACHLLLAGLRKMLGTQVEQKGSNITAERLRFDFNYDEKLTDEQIAELEKFVNNAIAREIPVERLEMTFGEAKQKGGYGVHKASDSDMVSVYKIGDVDFQICGGPHVSNTKELGKFKITKEQSSSAGVRRIRAELENK